MSTNDTVTALTGLVGAGVGGVVHLAWQDLRAYLRTHRALVEAEADAVLNKGIDIVVGTDADVTVETAVDPEPQSAQKAEPEPVAAPVPASTPATPQAPAEEA